MLEDTKEPLGENLLWCTIKFGVAWGVLQWQTRQWECIPIDYQPSGGCQRCTQRGSQGGATGISR